MVPIFLLDLFEQGNLFVDEDVSTYFKYISIKIIKMKQNFYECIKL